MNISKKLMLIVIVTIVEVSFTVWAALEISKGATFHQLNLLHLKYNAEFSRLVLDMRQRGVVHVDKTRSIVTLIREQPVSCLEQVDFINEFIMEQIDTRYALDICVADLRIADDVLQNIDAFEAGTLPEGVLLDKLDIAVERFEAHSASFEEPIENTVNFIVSTMITLILIISAFNIIFISYLSRTITNSIRGLIEILSNTTVNRGELEIQVEKQVSGELKELLDVAQERIERDVLNVETSVALQKILAHRTESLRKANDELAQFAYRASHDLKAPLTSSKSLAEFVIADIQTGDIDEALRNVQSIHAKMEKLENLVVDILSLAKADLDDGNYEAVDFEEIMQNIKDRTAWWASTIDCEVKSTIELTETIFSEKARLTQILENLISNGIKYRDTGKISPYVHIGISDDHENLIINIEDNGLGIPKESHQEVFKMFRRFHPNVGIGSGLGMSIIKKHVDSLEGSINFTTSSDGTKFELIIPKETVNSP